MHYCFALQEFVKVAVRKAPSFVVRAGFFAVDYCLMSRQPGSEDAW